jgi:hypothetical protein
MKVTVSGFSGAVNAPHPKLLPETVGTVSWNQKPGRGDFRPWRDPLDVATVPAGRKTIYRFGRDVAEDGRYWMSWTGIVHAVRGMVADDTTERTYYTGDGFPKWTDNTIALAGGTYPAAWRKLGVPCAHFRAHGGGFGRQQHGHRGALLRLHLCDGQGRGERARAGIGRTDGANGRDSQYHGHSGAAGWRLHDQPGADLPHADRNDRDR